MQLLCKMIVQDPRAVIVYVVAAANARDSWLRAVQDDLKTLRNATDKMGDTSASDLPEWFNVI